MNNDVPDKTIIRHLSKENKSLKLEIGKLKHEINNKELAINSFKKWQSRVADYKYTYWLNEGLKLASTPIDKEKVKNLRTVLSSYKNYDSLIKRLDNLVDQLTKSSNNLFKDLKQ